MERHKVQRMRRFRDQQILKRFSTSLKDYLNYIRKVKALTPQVKTKEINEQLALDIGARENTKGNVNVDLRATKRHDLVLERVLNKLLKCLLKLPEASPIRDLLRKLYLGNIVSSRIVEYPLIFKYLDLPRGSKILDVGCCYSLLSIQLASLGYKVWGLDVEYYPYAHPNFKFVKGDVRKTIFPDGYFDCVIAVSTIEHVGIPFSFSRLKITEEAYDENGDIKAMNEIRRILKAGGVILLTLPFGSKFQLTRSERIYNMQRLRHLLSGFKVEAIEYYVKIDGKWVPLTEPDERYQEQELVVFVKARNLHSGDRIWR
jgi:SAM-dependent methyltransferase